MDMDCKGTADLATKILSGNGSSQDETQLRSHGAACPACAKVERDLRRTWELMGQLQPVASRRPVPAAPRASLLAGRRRLVAAAAAVLVLSATAFALFRPKPSPAPQAPVAAHTPVEEPRPDQGEQENRVNDVLTKIEIDKAPMPQAPEAPKASEAPEQKPVVVTPAPPEPKPVIAPPQEPKEPVAKAPVPPTRPEDKPAPVVAPAPAASADPAPVAIAVLDRVEGDVMAVLSGKRIPATTGTKLASGDAIETSGKAGQAVVEFADGSRLVLGSDTIVDSIKASEGKRISLKQGVLAAQISKQPAGEAMVFLTSAAEARVMGTRLTLSATPTSTRLEVREGKVRVTRKDDNASVEVGANQVVQVGKGLSLTPKPVTTVRVALHEAFERRWSGEWTLGGEPNLGMKVATENGSLSFKTMQKPAPDSMSGGKMPTEAGEAARKALQNAQALATLTKKEWPRMALLETRQAYPFTNAVPLRIRTRSWNSHHDSDRVTWFAINRGVSGKGLALERRGASLQLFVEGATAPVWKKDVGAAQEWETLELWLSKDQVVIRRNEETLYTGANPLKVAAGTLSLGVNAKMELSQDEEVRFDDVDVLLTTRAELDEVAR